MGLLDPEYTNKAPASGLLGEDLASWIDIPLFARRIVDAYFGPAVGAMIAERAASLPERWAETTAEIKAGADATRKALKGETLTEQETASLISSPATNFGANDIGLPPAGLPLLAGTYLGRNSKTADLKALKTAKKMEKAGGNPAPDGNIRQETGWFKDPSGDWMYEISDLNARVDPHPRNPNLLQFTHPELEAAHPGITNMPIHKLVPEYEGLGWYGFGEAGIRGDLSPAEQRSVALHEIGGHAVQDREGFARGSTPSKNVARSQDLTQPLFDEANRRIAAGEMTEDQAMDWLREATKGMTAADLYRNHLGEFAARDIQARADYPDWKRQAVPPYSSEPTPPGGWIDNRGADKGGLLGPALSTDPPPIPIGASAGPQPHPLIGQVFTDMFEAIEAWKAAGGKDSGLAIQQTGPGTWVFKAEGSRALPTSGQFPGPVAPPPTIPHAQGVANPGGPMAPNNAGTPAAGPAGAGAGPPPFARPVAGPPSPMAVPAGALTDPEGRLLTAPLIAGIRQPGGVDYPLSMGEERWLANRLFNLGVHDDPGFSMRTGNRGQVTVKTPGKPNTLPGMQMEIDSRLSDEQYPKTFRHEVAHGIDFASERTGRTSRLPLSEINNIPPAIRTELETASGEMRPDLWALTDKEWVDYRHRPSELMADAGRYYKEDPQRFKALYPNAAKFIRDIVNEDPLLSQHIQFNVVAPGGGLLPAPITDETPEDKRKR